MNEGKRDDPAHQQQNRWQNAAPTLYRRRWISLVRGSDRRLRCATSSSSIFLVHNGEFI